MTASLLVAIIECMCHLHRGWAGRSPSKPALLVEMRHLPSSGSRQICLERRQRGLLGGFCRLAGDTEGSRTYRDALQFARVDW